MSAWISPINGRLPSSVTVTAVPGTGSGRWSMNRPEGSATHSIPLSCNMKQPTSSAAPNRFLTPRTMRSADVLSPSKCSTTSTRCSNDRGPAIAPSLVTWPTRMIAIKGYDPVAYFTQSKPVKGSASFTHQWMNSTWWFVSADDRDEFASTPEKYAPQYGGYCAYGVSQGHAVNIDPEAWAVIDGKLYLNYSKGVKKTWSEAIPKHIEEANRNWPGLHK